MKKSNFASVLAGKVGNTGGQRIEAFFKPQTPKAPKVSKGNDLRSK